MLDRKVARSILERWLDRPTLMDMSPFVVASVLSAIQDAHEQGEARADAESILARVRFSIPRPDGPGAP